MWNKSVLVLCALFTVSGILIGCGTASTQNQTNALKLTGNATAGKQLYKQYCSSCHTSGTDASKAYDAMKNGADGMPAFTQLTRQQQADIVAYVEAQK